MKQEQMPRHTRIFAINACIKDAEIMSKRIMIERKDKSDSFNAASFNAASFSAAMNHLTAGQGLRVLTKSDKAYAELLFGPITA